MTANSQLLTTTPKTKTRANRQTTRTGTEPQKWRSQGSGRGRERGKVQRISSINDRWKYVGNVEAKELISMTQGHEL